MYNNTQNHEKQKLRKSVDTSVQFDIISNNTDIRCPNCHQNVDKLFELCPHCGYRLHKTHCTFCGAEMSSDDLFCGECGGNTKGVHCPVCGTLSFRSFCPNCNSPVDELGIEAVKQAKEDPLYKQICSLAEKIIAAQEDGIITEDTENALSPEILSTLERYRSIQGIIDKESATLQNYISVENETVKSGSDESSESGIKLSDSIHNLPDLKAAVEKLNALMKSMVPDPGATPQMQRNYFSARKVAVYRKSIIREPVGWVCNLCGCQHRTPSECARPELGGTWLYQDKEIVKKTYE